MDGARDRGEGTALPRPAGRLEVERVGFVPSGVREPVLRQVSLWLGPGEALGIAGPSGAGKTTLVRLLVGSLAPTAGHVRLDGADVTIWPDADRGRHVGYLPQTVELFAGTVRDNISRLRETGDEEVVAAARRAGAHEVILALPAGYDTLIGEGGVPISGGQRQRIALARAVFGNPALVVLDEPNAHLDSDGELALIETVVAMRGRGSPWCSFRSAPGSWRGWTSCSCCGRARWCPSGRARRCSRRCAARRFRSARRGRGCRPHEPTDGPNRRAPPGRDPPAPARRDMGIRSTMVIGISVIAVFLGGFGAWAGFAPLERAAIAQGGGERERQAQDGAAPRRRDRRRDPGQGRRHGRGGADPGGAG